jgi:hypothetical protein
MTRKEYTRAYEQGHTDALKEILEEAEKVDDTYMIEYIKRRL